VAIQLEQARSELAQFSQEELSQVDGIISRNRGKPGALIPVLEQVQSTIGYLPVSIQMRIAQ